MYAVNLNTSLRHYEEPCILLFSTLNIMSSSKIYNILNVVFISEISLKLKSFFVLIQALDYNSLYIYFQLREFFDILYNNLFI